MTAALVDRGDDSRLCGARTRSGSDCRRPAGWGTDHVGVGRCKLHGGSTPTHRAAGRRMLAEREARKSIADVVVEPINNPLDALAQLAAEAAAWKAHLGSVVAELKDQYRFTDEKGAEHLDARVALFERAMDRCQKYLTDWVKLGFEERKVRLDEARADLVRVMTVGVLAELGHALEDPTVRAALERWAPVLDGAPSPAVIDANSGEEG